jgi:23S rRNA (cytidine2498-2'-O)-methyltransferase
VVVDEGVGAGPDHVFARQVLPDAKRIDAPSIAKLADATLSALLPELDRIEGAWRLDVFMPDEPADPHTPGELARRAAVLRQVFGERLARARRRLVRRSGEWERAPEGAALCQLLLARRETVLASVSPCARLDAGGRWPSPFAGGRARVPDDRTAPASAFRKLEEALAWMGEGIAAGEHCVDLGAAPGSWAHVALRRGAQVVAVDRGALAPQVARAPGLVQVRGDGFAYRPESPPVDWLLCDIIAAPGRSLELVDRWASEHWCRALVVHLKFKGQSDYALAGRALEILGRAGYRQRRVKHLFHDRNEVTVMARASGTPLA